MNAMDFNVFEGETLAFLGHNGAGKTTVMSMITGAVWRLLWLSNCVLGYCFLIYYFCQSSSKGFKI